MTNDELNQHLSNALESLRQCVSDLGNDTETRELLYHAGQTITALMVKLRERDP